MSLYSKRILPRNCALYLVVSSVFFNLEWFPNLCFIFMTLILFMIRCHACSVMSDSMDSYAARSSPPGSSVLWISQARILEWVAISSSRGSSRLRDQTHLSVSCIGRRILYHWATRKAHSSRLWTTYFCRMSLHQSLWEVLSWLNTGYASSVEWSEKWYHVLTASHRVADDFTLSLVILTWLRWYLPCNKIFCEELV